MRGGRRPGLGCVACGVAREEMSKALDAVGTTRVHSRGRVVSADVRRAVGRRSGATKTPSPVAAPTPSYVTRGTIRSASRFRVGWCTNERMDVTGDRPPSPSKALLRGDGGRPPEGRSGRTEPSYGFTLRVTYLLTCPQPHGLPLVAPYTRPLESSRADTSVRKTVRTSTT